MPGQITTSDAINHYGAACNEPDETARRALLERVWADDGVHCDPTVIVEGREPLVAHLGEFRDRMPGHRIIVTTGIDEHHDRLRFGWLILDPEGRPAIEGMDLRRARRGRPDPSRRRLLRPMTPTEAR